MWILVAAAHALPQLELPEGADPAQWADAAALAGFGAGEDHEGRVTISVENGTAKVVATLGREVRTAAVTPPTTAADREDVLLLGRSLLRTLEVPRTPWTTLGMVGPTVALPRALGTAGVGVEIAAQARRKGLTVGLSGRGLVPRGLRVGSAEWWLPVDLWGSVGGVTRGTTRLRLDGRVGVSVRAYGEPNAPSQRDWKPVAGLGFGGERDFGKAWFVSATGTVAVDLGTTRVESSDLVYTLGMVESGLSLAVGARFPLVR